MKTMLLFGAIVSVFFNGAGVGAAEPVNEPQRERALFETFWPELQSMKFASTERAKQQFDACRRAIEQYNQAVDVRLDFWQKKGLQPVDAAKQAVTEVPVPPLPKTSVQLLLEREGRRAAAEADAKAVEQEYLQRELDCITIERNTQAMLLLLRERKGIR